MLINLSPMVKPLVQRLEVKSERWGEDGKEDDQTTDDGATVEQAGHRESQVVLGGDTWKTIE